MPQQSEAKIKLSNTILQTPRLSLIPITKIASINESVSDPLNEYVKSKKLKGWKQEFEKFGHGLWCIHTDTHEETCFPLESSLNTPNRLSLNFTDDFNFRLPPLSSGCSSSSTLTCSPHTSITIGYIHLSQDSFINLGIFKRYCSQGYATEALKKLLSIIFDQDVTSVAHLRVEHDALARVLEKLGFMKKEKNVFSISRLQFRELWNSDDHE
jgi:RimJ/RimL family protein N-acetyltransferase